VIVLFGLVLALNGADAATIGAVAPELQKSLGIGDRRMVNDYLDSVREIEQRIQRAEKSNATSPLPAIEQPAGIPDTFDEHVKLLVDMLHLAYQGEITRVSCMQLTRESSGRAYPWIGVPESHHTVSHHQNEPQLIGQNTKINAYHMSIYARLIDKMKNTPDGDGTLLDHSILMYGAGMGDGDHHTPINNPVAIVGGGCGTLKGGRHLKYELNTPLMNAADLHRGPPLCLTFFWSSIVCRSVCREVLLLTFKTWQSWTILPLSSGPCCERVGGNLGSFARGSFGGGLNGVDRCQVWGRDSRICRASRKVERRRKDGDFGVSLCSRKACIY
jgi:hypothetical protein